ncbi:MAG TPA: glycosyltransferase family 39 protein [Pseudomonadota bacterium]|nr:glycosyltransferase family 39 protein [Pseudomonadota bacterium]
MAANRKKKAGSLFPVFVLRAGVLVVSALGFLAMLYVAARRLRYPLDLEWMEGGMLCHALRLFRGEGIYVAPSVDFVPHLYTPLYPAIVALVGKLLGDVTYVAARAVSLASFVAAIALCVWWVRKETGSVLAGVAGLAIPAATFAETGGFFDLARADSLQLLLSVAGAYVAFYSDRRRWKGALAALLLGAAFFAKQTAAPLAVASVLPLLLWDRRQAVWIGGLGLVGFGLVSLGLSRGSDGWFWTYIFRLHQSHAFFAHRAFVETPLTLFRIVGPGILLVPWAVISQATGRLASAEAGRGLYYTSWLFVAGMGTACLSFGTQWAHTNAYIPGVFFPALAVGMAVGRLLSRDDSAKKPTASAQLAREALLFCLLSLSVLLPLRRVELAAHIPTAADRQSADALLLRLAGMRGEVLFPFHPFYPHLVGKRTYLHRMGVWDVRGTVAGPVRELFASLRERRFSHIVMDDKVEATWGDWPDILEHYRVAERFSGPRMVEGARTVPALVLLPRE